MECSEIFHLCIIPHFCHFLNIAVLGELEELHSQYPRIWFRRGDYDVPCMTRKRYKHYFCEQYGLKVYQEKDLYLCKNYIYSAYNKRNWIGIVEYLCINR